MGPVLGGRRQAPQMITAYFGLDDGSKALSKNGHKEEDAAEGELEPEGLAPGKQKTTDP